MSRLIWDAVGSHTYETGVDRGVLYPIQNNGKFNNGIAWNGLSSISENPSGAEPTAIYADNDKYLNLMSVEEFNATIEAYSYPDEFLVCDGIASPHDGILLYQQKRKTFGLSYRTQLGNDVDGTNYGYKVHIIYGCLASPSEKSYSSVSDSPEAITFSWDISTTPIEVSGFKPTSHVVVDSSKFGNGKMAALEDILYGNENENARLPMVDEIAFLFGSQLLDSDSDYLLDSNGDIMFDSAA